MLFQNNFENLVKFECLKPKKNNAVLYKILMTNKLEKYQLLTSVNYAFTVKQLVHPHPSGTVAGHPLKKSVVISMPSNLPPRPVRKKRKQSIKPESGDLPSVTDAGLLAGQPVPADPPFPLAIAQIVYQDKVVVVVLLELVLLLLPLDRTRMVSMVVARWRAVELVQVQKVAGGRGRRSGGQIQHRRYDRQQEQISDLDLHAGEILDVHFQHKHLAKPPRNLALVHG